MSQAGSSPSSAPHHPGRRHLAFALLTLWGALIAGMLLRYGSDALDSDSVAQQSVVLTWWRTGHEVAYLPTDTWILKFPFYAVLEQLPFSAPIRLTIETTVLNGLGYLLVAWACWLIAGQAGFSRRWFDVVLPVAWLTTLSGSLGGYLSIMPNYRNIELGLAYLLVALIGRYTCIWPTGGDTRQLNARPGAGRRTVLGLLAVLAMALLWLDDPYFAVLLGAPMVFSCVIWFLLRQRDVRFLITAGLVAGSLFVWPVLRWVLEQAGIREVADPSAMSPDLSHLPQRVGVLWPSLQAQLGWQVTDSPGRLLLCSALGVLAVGAVACAVLGWLGWRARTLAPAFVGGHWLLVVVAVLLNSSVTSYHAGRYLMPAMLDLGVGVGLAAAAMRARRPAVARALTSVLVVALAANGALAAFDRRPVPAATGQRETVMAAIQSSGAAKGYANFWSTNIYIYNTGGALSISGIECVQGRMRLRYWLTDSSRTRVAADRSFLIWEAGYFEQCPLTELKGQLGAPVRQIPIPAPTTANPAFLLVYDHDLAGLLDPG